MVQTRPSQLCTGSGITNHWIEVVKFAHCAASTRLPIKSTSRDQSQPGLVAAIMQLGAMICTLAVHEFWGSEGVGACPPSWFIHSRYSYSVGKDGYAEVKSR